MILKLTEVYEGRNLLLEWGVHMFCLEGEGFCSIGCSLLKGEGCWHVKETIEEITQQIKEGGVCGTN